MKDNALANNPLLKVARARCDQETPPQLYGIHRDTYMALNPLAGEREVLAAFPGYCRRARAVHEMTIRTPLAKQLSLSPTNQLVWLRRTLGALRWVWLTHVRR